MDVEVAHAAQIIPFCFEGTEVRTIKRADGSEWFVAPDVCICLQIVNVSQATERLDHDEKGICTVYTLGGPQDVSVVSEPGLYRLTSTSRRPEAKRFIRWVWHDVLPTLRRDGVYAMPNGINQINKQLSFIFESQKQLLDGQARQEKRLNNLETSFAEQMGGMRGDLSTLTRRVDDMAPRHDFSDNSIRQFICVVDRFYAGQCPCCRKAKIVESGKKIPKAGHTDHANGPERNAAGDGWFVCKECNYKLYHDAHFKERSRPHFLVFQDNRQQLFGDVAHQSARKRKTVKTIADKRQGELF
jgi:prophage antirepressor-like protein